MPASSTTISTTGRSARGFAEAGAHGHRVRDVGAVGRADRPGTLRGARDLGKHRCTSGDQHDVGACRSEGEGGFTADAAGRAGDEDGFAVETQGWELHEGS